MALQLGARHDSRRFQFLKGLREQSRRHPGHAAAQLVKPRRSGDKLSQQDHGPSRAQDFRRHRNRAKLLIATLRHVPLPSISRQPRGEIAPAALALPVQFLYRGDSVPELAPCRQDTENCRHADGLIRRRRTKGKPMPLVDIQLFEGVFDNEQKQEMIRRVTDAMVGFEGEAMRGVTWVRVHEVASGEWAIGGRPLTTADVKALQKSFVIGAARPVQ
jgi:4-oxalocrotonate tautomerase